MTRQALKRLAAMSLSILMLCLPCCAAASLAPQQAQGALQLLLFSGVAVAAPAGSGEAAAQWLRQSTETVQQTGEADTAPPADIPQSTPHTETILPPESALQSLIDAIPPERRGVIETVQYAAGSTAEGYFFFGEGCIRNASAQNTLTLAAEAAKPLSLSLDGSSDEPQVLIVHTHTTESYDPNDIGYYDSEHPTRSTLDSENMIAVGEAMCRALHALGINAVHATEYHDYPSYTGAYTRSRETVRQYLLRYPSIKVVLDLHRDGIQRDDGTRVKPTAEIEGRKAAQLMLVVNADDGSGNMPYQAENLRFAARLQDTLQRRFPSLARPVLFDERKYNQDLMPGCLLVEIGSESSTLAEACYSAELLAACLAETLAGG